MSDSAKFSNEMEQAVTSSILPTVIDAGASFMDDSNQTHYSACGWLAIFAGLHFAYIGKRLPKKLADKLLAGELTPDKLKIASGNHELYSQIEQQNFTALSDYLETKIIVHYMGHSTVHGTHHVFTLDIWLYKEHHTLLLFTDYTFNPKLLDSAERFAVNFPEMGYTVKTLGVAQHQANSVKQYPNGSVSAGIGPKPVQHVQQLYQPQPVQQMYQPQPLYSMPPAYPVQPMYPIPPVYTMPQIHPEQPGGYPMQPVAAYPEQRERWDGDRYSNDRRWERAEQERKDRALAERLEAELRERMRQVDADEELARRLQEEWNVGV